jgi:hypothetical protein
VDIYFRKSSAQQVEGKSKMNWIDYLSTVGELLGLVLGMGFVSFIDVAGLGIHLMARSYNLNQWIA